jgi:hypothetical protein
LQGVAARGPALAGLRAAMSPTLRKQSMCQSVHTEREGRHRVRVVLRCVVDNAPQSGWLHYVQQTVHRSR